MRQWVVAGIYKRICSRQQRNKRLERKKIVDKEDERDADEVSEMENES